jgi:hypothetical protein
MALAVKDNEASNPGDVRLLGSPAVVPQADGVSDAIEEPWRRVATTRSGGGRRRRRLGHCCPNGTAKPTPCQKHCAAFSAEMPGRTAPGVNFLPSRSRPRLLLACVPSSLASVRLDTQEQRRRDRDRQAKRAVQ